MNRETAIRTTRAVGVAVLLAAACSLVGCVEIGGAAPTPSPATALTPAARPTVVVKRGAISDSVRILGRVAAAREADLYFPKAGKLKSIGVKSGQEVQEGQVIAELDTGELANQIAQAQTALETAEIKLREAKEKQADPAKQRELTLRTAELAVRQAEVAVAKAEEDLRKAKLAPNPVDDAKRKLRDAELALESAKQSLITTQKSETVSKSVRDREYEHNWYEAQYGKTLELQRGGKATEEDVGRDWRNLLGAKERLDSARATAALTLSQAEANVVKAEGALAEARSALAIAEAEPPEKATREAENALATAKLNLDKAKLDLDQKRASPTTDYETPLLEKAVDQARITLESLQSQMANSRLVAPFPGKVTMLRGKPGDDVTAYQTVASVADPRELVVRTDLADSDLNKIALGQKAALTIDAMPGQALSAEVVAVPSAATSAGGATGQPVDRSVRLEVTGLGANVQLGALARGAITVQEKRGALVVPARAVKVVGKRQYVEYMDGAVRRAQNVELGIVTENEAEVVQGLTEGQIILAGR